MVRSTAAGWPGSAYSGPVAPLHIHLVRHGQSTWNRQGRLQGQTIHPSLTALGRTQASDTAERLTGLIDGSAELWSSDLVRAVQTATLIGTRLRLPVQVDELLREQALGNFQGARTRDLRAQETPPGRHVSEVAWGGGESTAEVYRRVGRFLGRVISPADALGVGQTRHLILVSHGDTIRVARAWLQGRGHRDLEWDPLTNGSITSLTVA